ncbi:amidohydrolase 2 [Thozetella sp. PMI_491]|nr:amidohydrolase 2 [Thozetella sp. PMI_491]
MGSVSQVDARVPPGAWDSHVHVVDEDVFPFHPSYPYRPKKADLNDLLAFHQKYGIDHPCIVAMSVYHTDNSSILDALSGLGGKGRAVACVDVTTVTDEDLHTLHAAGVRAVRLNMRSRGDTVDLTVIKAAAARIRPLGWALQLYIALPQVAEVADTLRNLGVPAIIDHLGAPERNKGPGRSQKGYAELRALLQTGKVWTKLSGTYRFPDLPDLDDYVVDILRVAPDRVVWASDWPHSGGVEANPDGDRTKVQEYKKIDDGAFIVQCKKWCILAEQSLGEELMQKIWVDNPRRLWQYSQDD